MAAGSSLVKAQAKTSTGTRDALMRQAIKHVGGIHKALGVHPSQPIPAGKLNQAAASTSPDLRKKAQIVKTLSGMR
jgi:hypothetical protein